MRKNKLVPLGPTPDHTTDARKMVSRQQIREVFLRNGFTIKPGCDDLREYVYKAAFELLELAAPAVQGEPVGFVNPEFVRRLGVTFEAIVLSSEAGRDRTMPLYTTPQPAEQQPAPEVAMLVAALEKARDAIASLPQDALGNVPDTQQSQGWHIRDELINDISTALAAHRKGGDK